MQLKFIDRVTYKNRYVQEYIETLQQQYPNYFIVPEGGTNEFALHGVQDIITELNQQTSVDTIMLPVGSAGTLSGLIKADNSQHEILGIAVLNNADYLRRHVQALVQQPQLERWKLLTSFHRGGYAKFSQEDCIRLAHFIQITRIPLEPVYSGKMVLALLDLIEQGYFPSGHRIALIHTGGLQGLGGQLERNLLPESFIKTIQSHLPSAPPAQ